MTGFQGFGVIEMWQRYVGVYLAVEEARLTRANFEPPQDIQNRVVHFDTSAIRDPVPLNVRVAVEGTFDEETNTVHATYVKADAPLSLPAIPVEMSQAEFEERTHEEFKQGLQHGLNLAIRFLRRAATRNFQEKKDSAAKLLRDMADCLDEEKGTQRKTDYRVRPHIE